MTVSVSMKMSPKQAGKLYMKSLRLEEDVARLTAQNDRLRSVLDGFDRYENLNHAYHASEFKNEVTHILAETPPQSLAEHDATLLTRIATDIRNGIDAGDTANDAGVVEYIAGCIDEEAARMLKQADSKQGEV